MEFKHYAYVLSDVMVKELLTGILSSPIIYIPHYDLSYLKGTLSYMVNNRILQSIDSTKICFCNTFAFSENKKETNANIKYAKNLSDNFFSSNIKFEDGVYDAISRITNISYVQEIEKSDFDENRIFVFENIIEELKSPKAQYSLLKYAQCYEEGKLPSEMTIIIVDNKPTSELPQEIEKFIRVLDIPYPNINERKAMIDYWLDKISSINKDKAEKLKEDLALALGGLTFSETNSILRTISCAKTDRFLNKSCITEAFEEKQRIVQKSGLLEVVKPDVKFEDVGGLFVLKADIDNTKSIYFEDISAPADAALSYPKGLLIIGMPGCGKSMIAKAIAEHFHIPLLKMDISKIQGKYYGESEENLKKALKIAEMSSPCVLWIDEVEKAFSGADGKGQTDSLMIRVMGQFLTWQQEHKEPVYVVATANDAMRDEFMRKGRFDEVYFVNFPDKDEVKSIFLKKIKKYLDKEDFYNFGKCPSLSEKNSSNEDKDTFERLISSMCSDSVKFTGAEIEHVIKLTMELRYKEYVDRKRDNLNENYVEADNSSIVEYKHFEEQIEKMSPYIMYKSSHKAREKDSKKDDNKYKDTAIDRIFDLYDQYKFKEASSQK